MKAAKSASRASKHAQPAAAPDAQDAVFEALSLALQGVAPARPAALRKRILSRVAQAADADVITVPASEEGWTELLPKVRGKRVYTDGTAESWLIRLEPGARAPAHGHPGTEECMVLQGSIRYLEGSVLHAGDYEAVMEGGRHSELVSDSGALVFLRYSQPLRLYVPL